MPIQIRNLSHTYSEGSPFQATAIDNVSLTIDDGEFIGVIGHTGSGKSTLIQHLNGLLKPTQGQVLIDGEDIHAKGFDRRAVRQKIGLVFQYPEHQLFEETVIKDVAFGPKNLGLPAEEIDQRVRRALENVHLDYDAIGPRSPFELSGGQMRRVAIAGVLAMEPKVLILDEPTAGLDPRGRDRILAMVKSLHAKGGLTVVMVTHAMDEIAALATRLIVMSKGELVMSGTPREVFKQREEMARIGLGVPQAAQLAHALHEMGCEISDDIYTLDELEEALLRLGEVPHA